MQIKRRRGQETAAVMGNGPTSSDWKCQQRAPSGGGRFLSGFWQLTGHLPGGEGRKWFQAEGRALSS